MCFRTLGSFQLILEQVRRTVIDDPGLRDHLASATDDDPGEMEGVACTSRTTSGPNLSLELSSPLTVHGRVCRRGIITM